MGRNYSSYTSVRDVLQLILADKTIITDRLGNSYEYNGKFWEPLPIHIIENYAYHYDPSDNWSSPRKPKWVAYHVQQTTLTQENIPWENLSEVEVPFQNGVYNAKTRKLRPHRKEDYLKTVWPVQYIPKAEAPTWDIYLETCFGNLPDFKERVEVLEEFLGYILIQKAPYKKSLLCSGESNTGKTVLEKVMEGLVGESNVCHLSIDKMDNPREAAPIEGKALNVMSELRFGTILSDSGFKRLVSIGESIQIDPKWQQPRSYHPFCKHVVFTNVKPTIHDHTDAVYNRLIMLEFPNVISPEQQDPNLPDKLELELEGIAQRALKGLRRLTENKGQFTIPPSMEAELLEYKRENNPVFEFLQECFTEHPKGYVFMDDVRQAFRSYFPKSGHWSNKRITQALKKAGYEIKETSREGQKGNFLFGVILNSRYTTSSTLQYGEKEEADF